MPRSPVSWIVRQPGTPRLLGSALVGRVPDSIAATAIVVLVHSATGSYPDAGLAAAAFGAGTAVSAPLAGRLADRFGQRPVLPVLAVAFGLALTLLAVTSDHIGLAGMIVLAVAAGLARPPLEAALRAAWPRLVPADRLDSAYALDSTAQELIWIGGPLLLAALLAAGDSRLPLLVCAVLSVAGTTVYASSPRLPGRSRPAAALFGAALMLLAAAPGLLVLALLMIPLGLPLSPWLGSLSAAAQRAVPASAATEAFSWVFAVITVAMAIGNAVGGLIIEAAGPALAFVIAGALCLSGAGLGALRYQGPAVLFQAWTVRPARSMF